MKGLKDSLEDALSSSGGNKRILIIGNGFDLAVGRKTSYKDFYESDFCPKHYPAPLIYSLNGKLNDESRWLDLEAALQEYALSDQKKDCLRTISVEIINAITNGSNREVGYNWREDILRNELDRLKRLGFVYEHGRGALNVRYNLTEYQKGMIDRDITSLTLIEEKLAQYLNSIESTSSKDSVAINLLKDFMDDDLASIYSFNYTKVGTLLTNDGGKAQEYDDKVQYLHGSLRDGHVIIGTKDGDYGDYDFVQKTFDSNYNPPALLKDMLGAEEIVVFGHSLGDCDSQYFEPFFKRQSQNIDVKSKKITIYTYDKKSEVSIKKNLNKLTNNHLSWLYSMNEFKIENTKEI